MTEPFFPQLVLFVARPPLLALYREFLFPSVPGRTGLLPLTLDEIHVANRENTPMAIDIALTRAAIVVYDSGPGGRPPLDFVRTRRGQRPLIVITAPESSVGAPPAQSLGVADDSTVARPPGMERWPESFIEPLLSRLARLSAEPSADTIAARLRTLVDRKEWATALLDALALLERRLRMDDVTAALPPTVPGGVMKRLETQFGPTALHQLLQAVSLRHQILQGISPQGTMQGVTQGVIKLVWEKYQLPSPAPAPTV